MLTLSMDYALELVAVFILGALVFSLSYALSERLIVGVLIVMIPFQIIDSRFGSLNMVLTYLVGLALLQRRRIGVFPLMPVVMAILLVYLLSTSLALRATWFDHATYILSIGSGFFLFYIAYNFVLRSGDVRYLFKLLVAMNILVILYCGIQLTVGFDQFAVLGVQEWSFAENRWDYRLVGPFGAPGVNAGYFVLQMLVLAYLVLISGFPMRKWILYGVMASNFGLLLATGSRGGFLTLLVSIPLFLFFFRRELRFTKIVNAVVVGAVVGTAMAFVIINFTQFNVIFDRLGETVIEGGVPDTRQKSFEITLERIPDAPVLGHGPRLRLIDEINRRIPGYASMPAYPHNLVLFLLYTVGAAGLLAYGVFFFQLGRRFLRAQKYKGADRFDSLSARLGLLLLIVFLIDELKIEFLRANLTDIQHYLFVLWGTLLAMSDRSYAQGRSQIRK